MESEIVGPDRIEPWVGSWACDKLGLPICSATLPIDRRRSCIGQCQFSSALVLAVGYFGDGDRLQVAADEGDHGDDAGEHEQQAEPPVADYGDHGSEL